LYTNRLLFQAEIAMAGLGAIGGAGFFAREK